MVKLLDTPSPAAIWSPQLLLFDKSISDAQNVALSHGRYALSSLIRRIDDLYLLLKEPPLIENTYLAPEIPQTLSELCYHQGVVSTILFNNSMKAKDEGNISYKLRRERFSYIDERCNDRNVPRSALSDRVVRNKLTHVDDHLMKAMRRPNTGWCIDMAIAFRDQFQNSRGLDVEFCRTFEVEKERILHLGSEISVRDLRSQAAAVLAVVFDVPSPPPPDPPPTNRLIPQTRLA